MRKIELVTAGSGASSALSFSVPLHVEGPLGRRLASPPEASTFLEILELAEGTSVAWNPIPGDVALFVERGLVSVDGRSLPAGSAIVVEAGASLAVEALAASRLLHFGPQKRGPQKRGSHEASVARPAAARAPRVHLIGPRGRFEAIEPGREPRFFVDASCDGCSAWLLYTARSVAYESPVHSHSQDELIHVLRGEISLGSLRAGPGTTLFIAADQPYRFRAGAAGFAFLNYRQAGSRMTLRPSGEQIVESGAATGMRPVADESSLERAGA